MKTQADKQAKAQRDFDALRMSRQRNAEKCQRCGEPRWAHNRGNRAENDSICKMFLEIGEAVGERKMHESDGMVYTSNPPQYRCVNCGQWYQCSARNVPNCFGREGE